MPKVSRLEVIQSGARRRWTPAKKRRIVAETDQGPRQVSATGRQYGLSASQLFGRRRLARDGRLGGDDEGVGFAQAVIACEGAASLRSVSPPIAQGRMEILLANGLRVIVGKDVDAGALARVVGALDRR
jgi:transposase